LPSRALPPDRPDLGKALRFIIDKWGGIYESENLCYTFPLSLGLDGSFVEFYVPLSTLRDLEDLNDLDRSLAHLNTALDNGRSSQ